MRVTFNVGGQKIDGAITSNGKVEIEQPKQGLFDLSIQWEQDGEKKTVMLFEKIALDDLNTGCFSENNPEEPLFGEL